MNGRVEHEQWRTAVLAGVVLLGVLLILNLALLFFVFERVAESRPSHDELEAELRRQVKKLAGLEARYEQHKVQLYELDNRLTQAEARQIAKESTP